MRLAIQSAPVHFIMKQWHRNIYKWFKSTPAPLINQKLFLFSLCRTTCLKGSKHLAFLIKSDCKLKFRDQAWQNVTVFCSNFYHAGK